MRDLTTACPRGVFVLKGTVFPGVGCTGVFGCAVPDLRGVFNGGGSAGVIGRLDLRVSASE